VDHFSTGLDTAQTLSEHEAWAAVIENLNVIAKNNNSQLGLAPIWNVSATCTHRISRLAWSCDGLLDYHDASCAVMSNPATVVMDPEAFDYVSVNWHERLDACVRKA
jgi:hypothetical protein